MTRRGLATFGEMTKKQLCSMGEIPSCINYREIPRCEPWCWNIYLHDWAIFGGKSSQICHTLSIWDMEKTLISHMLHGAGIYIYMYIYIYAIYIYANMTGVYWWDPFYHIYQHHGSYGYKLIPFVEVCDGLRCGPRSRRLLRASGSEILRCLTRCLVVSPIRILGSK